jgi:predicted negative regulator of RcsB-dependent stress response
MHPDDNQLDRGKAFTNMNTKTKFWIRVLVVAGIVAWPSVETYRLWATNQKLVEAQVLQKTVQAKVDSVRAKHTQVAGAPDTTATSSAK